MTAGNQALVSYSYDGDGRLSEIAQGSSSVGFTYDGAGRRSTTMSLPDQITAAYSYNQASRLTDVAYSGPNGQIGTLTYNYDAAGHIIATGGTLARTGLPAATALSVYNAGNQLTQWNNSQFTYDANGSLISDGSNTYHWDARNRLASISGSQSATFQYDGLGRRQAKVIASSQTNFLFDGINSVQEQGVDGSAIANILTGFGADQTLARTDAAGTHRFLTDALGSTLALADSDGTLSAQYVYDPFGGTSSSGSTLNPTQYTGRENDGTGLYYYRARYYSAGTGRFISEDPVGLLSRDINFYRYAFGNPTRYRDPSGTTPPEAVIGAIYGGVYGALGAIAAGGNGNAIAQSAAIGALTGGVLGALSPLGVAGSAIGGAAGGYVGSAWTQYLKNGEIDQGQAVGSALAGAVGGWAGAGIGELLDQVGAGALESVVVSNFVGSNIGFPTDVALSNILNGKLPSPSLPRPK